MFDAIDKGTERLQVRDQLNDHNRRLRSWAAYFVFLILSVFFGMLMLLARQHWH